TTFFISIYQSLLHPVVHGRIQQIQQRKKTAKSIPKTRIGKHLSWQDLSVIWTIMHTVSFSVNFRKIPRKECGAVQTGIKGTQAVDILIFNADTSKYLIPLLATFVSNLFQGFLAHFI